VRRGDLVLLVALVAVTAFVLAALVRLTVDR